MLCTIKSLCRAYFSVGAFTYFPQHFSAVDSIEQFSEPSGQSNILHCYASSLYVVPGRSCDWCSYYFGHIMNE